MQLKIYKIFKISILLIFIFNVSAYSARVKGVISDENNQALPFVNIFLKGTTIGTTSNMKGEYVLDLKSGEYEIVFKIIGYKQLIEKVRVENTDVILNVKMLAETYSLKEVTIQANAEDPAYEVIRQAIKKRKYYLNQVDGYSADVYIKGLQRITKHPKKILGFELDPEGDIDTVSGIVYLSESVSKFNFKQENKIKEEMISSKVSGDNNAFSYNQASDLLFNFYENVIEVGTLSERGFISPISNNAFFSYRFKLLGTFYENDQMINKIQVIPKRKTDPVFSGIIYIAENTWRIHSLDLTLTKDANIEFVDTLHIHQTFLPVEKDVWMVFSNRFVFSFRFLGIEGNGVYTGIQTNYIIDPEFPKKFFTNEVLKINDEANKKDTSYWKKTRPIPLTKEETDDYRKKDSLMQIRNSKNYLDSMDAKNNTFKWSNLLLGYAWQNRYRKEFYKISSLLQDVNFNTVSGWNVGINLEYNKRFGEKNKSIRAQANANYGFSNKIFFPNVNFRYTFKPQKFEWIELGFGRIASQYNERQPIWPVLNTYYTIIGEENYMKIFDKQFVKATHNVEIVNGIILNSTAEYALRNPLLNTSNYKFIKSSKKEYTSNDPLNPFNTMPAFKSNSIFSVDFIVTFRYKQKYYTEPNSKIILGSKYPELSVRYKKSIPGIGNSSMNFSLFTAILKDKISMKLFGRSSWTLGAGTFLAKSKIEFTDYYHFMGNNSDFSSFSEDAYNLLDYYTYSTQNYFYMGSLSHNFEGFFFNKIPLLRKLKLHEVIEVKYLNNDKIQNYTEWSVGIQKLVIRLDFVTSYTNEKKIMTGFRFGLFLI